MSLAYTYRFDHIDPFRLAFFHYNHASSEGKAEKRGYTKETLLKPICNQAKHIRKHIMLNKLVRSRRLDIESLWT